MSQCHRWIFFHRISPANQRVFCHTFHIWAYTLPAFKLKVYLCLIWSWGKLNPCQTQACRNFKKKKWLTFQKSITITWKVGNSFVVLLLLHVKSSHTTWNIFILEQSNPEINYWITILFVFREFPSIYALGKRSKPHLFEKGIVQHWEQYTLSVGSIFLKQQKEWTYVWAIFWILYILLICSAFSICKIEITFPWFSAVYNGVFLMTGFCWTIFGRFFSLWMVQKRV